MIYSVGREDESRDSFLLPCRGTPARSLDAIVPVC